MASCWKRSETVPGQIRWSAGKSSTSMASTGWAVAEAAC
jgi:hypothetical protein